MSSEKAWEALTAEEITAAELLGYNEALWDGNGKIPLEEKDWDELTPEQRAAAETLGMDEDDWDDDGKTLVIPLSPRKTFCKV